MMNKYGHDAFDGIARKMHGQSENWLDTIQTPDNLERFSVEDLKHALAIDGYETMSHGEITIGWGRKVDAGKTHAKTAALFISEDKKLVSLCIGGHGSYEAAELVQDCENPTPEELKGLKVYYNPQFSNIEAHSTNADRFLDKHSPLKADNLPDNETARRRVGIIDRIKRLLSS